MKKKDVNNHSLINNISIDFCNNNTNKSINNNDKAISKDSEILKLFCPDITKINEKDECNWTPLYRSIISGNIKATQVLLNNGADPNIQCSMGETSLYQAVDMEKLEHVKLLLRYGADPNISQIDGLSSLHLAVLKQNIIIIKNLLKYKANPNKQSSLYKQTPVHLAIKNNVDSMILLILANSGGLLTIKDKFGKKPIDYINSEEMRKTVEMLKLEKNNENFSLKKIYFTPSKNNKYEIMNVISKTIKSVSPKLNGLKKNSNIITLKDSGKSKFNFVEIKSGEKSNKKNENEIGKENKSENINNNDDNLKIDLFNSKKDNKNNIYCPNKKSKYFYKNEKFGKMNKYSNNTYKIIESPIQEESSSIISTNKYLKNSKIDSANNNYKNIMTTSFSNSNIKTAIKRNSNNFPKTDIQQKYIRKKSTDKHSSFKCTSSKNIKKELKRNNTEEIKTKKNIFSSPNLKNIQNSRNIKNILIGDLTNKNGNFLTNNSITNSITDTFTNYKTQFTTNSNKAVKDKNSSYNSIKEDKSNIIRNTYNKPKVLINPYLEKNKKFLPENINPILKAKIMRNKNKNFFNSKYKTYRNNQTSKVINIMNKEQKPYIFTNNNDKENISMNIKNSFISGTTRNSNNEKMYSKNSFNSNQSICTFYTYTKNENNSLLEVVEKTKHKIYKKETLPIYKWLQEIDLLVYLPLFIKKKIYSFEKIISDLKSKKIIIAPNDIKKIGIDIPGHIYRIFVKLEIDAELIDKKIYEYVLFLKKEEEKNIKNGNYENEESTQSLYDCCGIGCCSLKKSHIKVKVVKNDLRENKIFMDLDKWLKNINMIKYKDNFIKSGFDKIEFFILQMFSSLPLEEKIFENEINIENNNDIDLFILQLNKDVKLISNKFKKKRSSSVEVDKKAVSKYLLNKENNSRKKLTRTSSNVCAIF